MVGFCPGFSGQKPGCCNYIYGWGPTQSDGRYFWCFRTGADESPLQGRSFSEACPQGRRRIGYIFIREKDYVFKRSTEQVFKGNHAL